MKRSEALNLIANQLDFLHGEFVGVRDDFSPEELSNADVILTTLEEAGMKPPIFIKTLPERNDNIARGEIVNEWEPE